MNVPINIILYTRPGCHLCEDAEDWLRDAAESAGASLRLVNILADSALYEQYKWRIPVVQIGFQSWEAPLDPAAISAVILNIT